MGAVTLICITLAAALALVNSKGLPSRTNLTKELYSEWAKPVANLLLSNPSPTCFMSTPQLIEYYGYPVETHNVTTEDGYKLTLFRIPQGNTGAGDKEPVVLFHGVLSSSDDWLLLSPNKTLAYLLADLGHDVWLANSRGNKYSQAHVTLSPDDLPFWNFSYHEMDMFDIPAIFDYVLNNTNRTQGKLSYVGHSMGTTMFFIAMDRNPSYQAKVRKMTALAPVAYLRHMKTPSVKLALSQVPPPAVRAFFIIFSGGRVIPKEFNDYMKLFGPIICSGDVTSDICTFILYFIGGFELTSYSRETASMIVGHTPTDASGKTIVHFLQYVSRSYLRLLDAGICNYTALGDDLQPAFQQYDYGCVGNLRKYNTSEPPKYNLTANNVETMVMYGNNDFLVQPPDALRTISELGNVNSVFTSKVADDAFNHHDFLYKDNVREQVLDHVVSFLSEGAGG